MRVFLFSLILVSGVFLCAPAASAATIYSNYSTGDDTTGDGSSGTPYKTFHKAYTIASSGDTINLSGTFTWSNADETGDSVTTGYTIGKSLTIVGQGATSTTIQSATTAGTADRRVFTISTANTVTVRDMTIRYGRVTGGSDYGGGIYNQGTTTVERLNVSNNYSGGYGGGIAHGDPTNGGSLTVRDSLVSFNTGVSQGGGLYAILTTTGPMHVVNSTVVHNTLQASSGTVGGGGVAYRGGNGTITNSTIAYNNLQNGGSADGAGVWFVSGASQTLQIKNSIVTNNYAQGVALTSSRYDVDEDSGIITDNGYNIFGRYTSSQFATTSTTWVDQQGSGTLDDIYTKTGTAGATLNLSDGLAFNDTLQGTQTLAIASTTSVAINNGSADANGTADIPTTDARGASRNGTTDIGAFEVQGGGLTVVAPTTQASSVTFSTVEYKRMTVSWTKGSGSRRVVFMKQANTGTASPVDGSVYAASTTFGSGNQIGSTGWYAIHDSASSTSATITGLTAATDYIVQVFEYNGVSSGGGEKYFTDTASGNPATQTTYTPITRYANATSGDDSTGDGTSGAPYKTFHKLYTVGQQGDTLNISGTFTWTDTAESGDAATTGYTLAKDLTISGQSAASTIIQASSTNATADRRVFTVSAGYTVTIASTTVRYGRVTSASSFGGGIYNQGTLTLRGVDVSYNSVNQSGSGIGGGVAHENTITESTLTVRDSAIHHNTAASQGGGIGGATSGSGNMDIINSTIAFNIITGTVATLGGGGISFRGDGGTITNSTIAYNDLINSGTPDGAGVWFNPLNSSATLQVKNSIVSGNYYGSAALSTSKYDIYEGAGTLTDNGYNIFGRYTSSQFATTSTTWVDQQGSGTLDGTFTKTGSAGGTLSLGSALATNNGIWGTQTLAITLSGSIAVDNGSTDANGGISIPANDQRGGTRSGATDVGAFEYGAGGLTDTTAPTVSISAPTAAAYVAGASVSITATAGDETSLSGVKFYVDNTLQGSEDTSSPYSITWDSTATTTGAHTVFAVARDASANFATSSSVSFTVDNTAPTVSLTAPANSATIGGSAITLSADASDSTSLAGVKFYVNNVFQGSEDTSSPYSISWNSTATTSGTKIIVAVARDSANNYATSSSVSVTLDNTAPTASTLVPADNATSVAATTTLAITFSESVTAVAGKNITIKKSTGGGTVETIAANDTSKVTVSGTGVTITPSAVFEDLVGYYINIESGSFVDAASNAYTGITDTTSWSFTTRDITVPTVSSFSPTDGATSVSPTANLVVVFSETVTAVAAKNIVIKKSSDDTTVETIVANNTSLVTVSGATVTINPAATLAATTGYYVQIDSGAFKDAANLNYAGIANATTWNFTVADASVPTVSLTLPNNGATISGSAIGMTATASDDVSVAGVRFYVNNIAVGPEDTSSPYTFVWNSLATSSGTKVVVAVARDSSNNYATSTSATVTLGNAPTPSSLVVTPATTTAAVSWTTPVEGSSKMYFGIVTSIGSSTPEANAGSGVTSHSVNLSGLPACTVYRYVTVSKTEGGDVATSSSSTFKTAGCTGSASILSNSEGAITTASGGTLTEGSLTLTVPASFTGSASTATFQANKLDGSTFFSSISPPSGKNRAGTSVYNLKALTDETSTLSSFSQPLTVTLAYEDSDVSGLNASTLKIHRYDSDWTELSSCTVDTSAKTVSCTTTNFSDFAIFGSPSTDSSSSSSNSSGTGGAIPWCSGPLAAGWNTSLPNGGCGIATASVVLSVNPATTSATAHPPSPSTTAVRSTTLFKRTLRAGLMGEDVRALQKILNAQSFILAPRGIGSPGNESDYFGTMTHNALIKFQEAYAQKILAPLGLIHGSGIFGPSTRAFVNLLSP